MFYTLRFFSSKCSLFHNANLFGSCIIHILYTECAKLKKNNSGAKGLKNHSNFLQIFSCQFPKKFSNSVLYSFLIHSMYVSCADHHNHQCLMTAIQRYYKMSKFHGLRCFTLWEFRWGRSQTCGMWSCGIWYIVTKGLPKCRDACANINVIVR